MARREPSSAAAAASDLAPTPPERHPLQLVISSILMGLWLVFLALMAFAA